MGETSKGQRVAYAAAVLLALAAVVRYVDRASDQGGEAVAPVALDGGSTSAEGRGDTGNSTELFVHVAGAVRREGLYRVDAGSRVGDALKRAGGPRAGADLSRVNLAANVQDGQQVVVPRRGDEAAATAALAGSTASAPGAVTAGAGGSPISLGSATAEQLDAGVEGIGPTIAARIVEYREQNGGFSSVEELSQVDGIGEARLTALREAVSP